MTNKIKQLTKIGILSLGITLFIWNCQKDDTSSLQGENTETHQNNVKSNYVSGDEIPSIINLLGHDSNRTSKPGASKSSTIPLSFGSISIENILETIDTLGNKKYSFKLTPKTPKVNSIFNLVIDASIDPVNIALFEYRMSPNFAQNYHDGLKTFSEFTGSIIKFPFSPDLASNSFSKTSGTTCIQNIDEIVDCSIITVDGGTAIVGGGGGGTGDSTTLYDTTTYTGANGGSSGISGNGSHVVWVCTPCGVSHTDPSECRCSGSGNGSGGGGAEGTWIVVLYPNSYTNKSSNNTKRKTENCCDETVIVGEIGVNFFDLAIEIRTALNISGRSLEGLWLTAYATDTQLAELNNFIENNKDSNGDLSPEEQELGKSIIEVLRVGNTSEKELANAFLNEDIKTALQLLIGDNQTIDCCEYNPECCDEIFDPMVQLTARIVIDARDGAINLISAWVQHNLIISQNRKGKFVRNVMEQMGVDVPIDVDNETLAELFKVRQRNLELVVEPVEDYLNELLDIGISIIDVLAIVSPSKGAGAFIFAKTGTGTITAKALSDHLKTIANIASTTLSGGKGYKSFNAFKRAHGNASSGNALHHIVEQNGFQSFNQLKFGRTNIHNTKNIIDIPTGTGSLHNKVTSYYNSIDLTLNPTKRVREAIKDWSFQEQYDFGISKLKEFGWDGVTGIIN